MPGPGRAYGPALARAVREARLAETDLDAQVLRILSVLDRLGLVGGEAGGEEAPPQRPTAERRCSIARRAAVGSILLLKN